MELNGSVLVGDITLDFVNPGSDDTGVGGKVDGSSGSYNDVDEYLT